MALQRAAACRANLGDYRLQQAHSTPGTALVRHQTTGAATPTPQQSGVDCVVIGAGNTPCRQPGGAACVRSSPCVCALGTCLLRRRLCGGCAVRTRWFGGGAGERGRGAAGCTEEERKCSSAAAPRPLQAPDGRSRISAWAPPRLLPRPHERAAPRARVRTGPSCQALGCAGFAVHGPDQHAGRCGPAHAPACGRCANWDVAAMQLLMVVVLLQNSCVVDSNARGRDPRGAPAAV